MGHLEPSRQNMHSGSLVNKLQQILYKSSNSFSHKYVFAFADFDADDMLGIADLQEVLKRLIGENEFSENDMKQLIQSILAEADLDDDHALSFPEFEQ